MTVLLHHTVADIIGKYLNCTLTSVHIPVTSHLIAALLTELPT